MNFSYPKPLQLLEYLVSFHNKPNGIVLDYFSGSGTTANAVIELRRKEKNHKKFILIEMGDYFGELAKPRVMKVSYSKDWKDGKPISRDGISQVIKYINLEQYEDTLDNLGMKKNPKQGDLLKQQPKLNEDYILNYMLEMESRGSSSLLNIDAFANPFAYKLRITRNDDTQEVNVDLVETFNYLLGLVVKTVDRDKNGIVTVTGTNSLGEHCLILWRNLHEIDNDALDHWFGKRYSSRDREFDAIYVNGDNNIENMKLSEEHWKVRLIEPEFKRLMFDVQDV